MELEPGNPAFLRSLGQALRGCGRHEEAIAVLGRLLALAPDDELGLQVRVRWDGRGQGSGWLLACSLTRQHSRRQRC